MKAVSRLQLRCIILASSAAAALCGSAAIAQVGSYQQPVTQEQITRFKDAMEEKQRTQQLRGIDGKAYDLSSAEEKSIRNLQAAIARKDGPAGLKALAAAKAAAKGKDAQLVVASLQLQLGTQLNDAKLESEAVDALLASGRVPQGQLAALYRNQASFAVAAGDLLKAETAYSKLVEVTPTDAEAYAMLAQTKSEVNKPGEALASLRRAIELKKAANQPVPQSWTDAATAMSQNLGSGTN